MLQTPNCQYAPPSSVQAEGTCTSISKLKRFGTKHFPDSMIQNAARLGLCSEETFLDDRTYNIDTAHQMSIGTTANHRRGKKTSSEFVSNSARLVIHPTPEVALSPGEYFTQQTFEAEHAMSFARTASGGPSGSSNFVNPMPRLPGQPRQGGFPRPMLSLEAEEGRNKWTSDNGTTVTGSDRWRGGLFDKRKLQAGPETIKNGHKNMAQRVECSPLKYSEMGSTVGRTIGSPAFLTKDGVRTGANVSIPDATARIGPGSYANATGGGPSSNPLVTAGAASAFKGRVPRFTDSSSALPDTKYKNDWDTKHWNRTSATGKISGVSPKNCFDYKGVDSPGPGAYHKPAAQWEDNAGLVATVMSPAVLGPKWGN